MTEPYLALPAFDAHGNLPPGDYWPAQTDFEERFVHLRSTSSRADIYDGFKRHRSALLAAGIDQTADCLLDGSYTTSKLDPGDIDLVVEVEATVFDSSARVQELLSGPDAKQDFHCDAYPLLVYPQSDPHFQAVTVQGRAYWRKWFGRDRQNQEKGHVWAKAQGFR
jgi:hypothetical protein